MTREVRLLAPHDAAELVRLCREHAAFERAGPLDGPDPAALIEMFVDVPETRCWVIDGDGELAGFASAAKEHATWHAARYAHLDCLFLRPAYRGRGLGRRLVSAVAAWALDEGLLGMQWQTPPWNEDAIGFYARIGASGRPKVRFSLDEDGCRALGRRRNARLR